MTEQSPLEAIKMGFAPQDVEHGIDLLIDRFGSDAVREAAKQRTALKTGRKPEKDDEDLKLIYFEDSELWLQG